MTASHTVRPVVSFRMSPCGSPAEVADDAPSEAGVPGRGPERPCLHAFAVAVHVSSATMSLAATVAPEAMPAKKEDSPGSWGASQTCFAKLAFRLMLRNAETSLGVNW